MKNTELITVVIVEREKDQRHFLENILLRAVPDIFILASVDNPESLIRFSKPVLADIIIADPSFSKIIANRFDWRGSLIYTQMPGQLVEFEIEDNVIGILNKPFNEKEILRALNRYITIKKHFFDQFNSKLFSYQQNLSEKKERIVARKGNENSVIKIDEVAYLYNQNRLTFVVDVKGNKFFLDHPLVKIQKFLDPSVFFRVSRKYLVNINSIKKFRTYNKAKIHLTVEPAPTESILVSSSVVSEFRRWIGEEFG